MMYYAKAENLEEELKKDNIPIECLPNEFLWMNVKGGTKISNVIDYAKHALDSGKYRSIVWSGTDAGVVKTISCAEILKRTYDLHQITRICYRRVEEYWNPKMKGLDPLVAKRKIPCVHILLSLDEINSKTLGYQHSRVKTKFYDETITLDNSSSKQYDKPFGRFKHKSQSQREKRINKQQEKMDENM